MKNASQTPTAPSAARIVVVGGGIVGLATAMKLQAERSDTEIVVVETEKDVSMHQSGHNSGVLHSGLYYRPGSIKALTCRAGKAAMETFCHEHHIPWDRCGKVVVATTAQEVPRLEDIAARATENGVEFRRINTDELRRLEPAVAGLAALHVPETGIVDYRQVCRTMVRLIESRGGSIKRQFQVTGIRVNPAAVTLTSAAGESIDCDHFVGCGGLQSDRLFQLAGGQSDVRIVPFRGEYYELTSQSQSLCRNLIYPVPDPSFPFLGVHFTRMIDGGVECGPNAVLALSRGGYRWRDINVKDLTETVRYPGFLRLAGKHWKMGLGEMARSVNKAAFVRALQKLIPSIQASDLTRGRAGVRAQAVTPEGNLLDDFLIKRAERSVHVLNAPSPAATASLAIADMIVGEVLA